MKLNIFKSYGASCMKKKIQRTMKFTILLSIVFTLQVSAASYGQKNISVYEKNAALENVLKKVKQQSGFSLLFIGKDIKAARPVTVNLNDVSLETALNEILKGQLLTFTLELNTIVIKTDKKITTQPRYETNKTNIDVKGKVLDENGNGISGATVKVKGNRQGVVTAADGSFLLKDVDENAIIIISFVGYSAKEVKVTAAEMIIRIEAQPGQLNDVVVVGYGSQRKSDLTGAVANISANKLNTQSNPNIGQALQGKIAGVDIVSQGGAPGSGTRISIRGIGTLNNANPLFIVDGIYMNSMDNINPNDVASIDVLKDASSAAIYGSRAANGVIIITTKTGFDTDGKPVIELAANAGVQSPTKYLEMLNAADWARISTLSREAIGKPALEMAQNLNDKEDNDWQRTMMGPALMQNYNLTISGGSKYFTYYTGMGFLNQQGIIKGTKYQRINGQVKMQYKRDWLTLGNNIIISNQQDNPLYSFNRGGYLGIILQSIPTLAKYDPNNVKGGYGKVFGDATDIPNPLGILDENLTRRTRDDYKVFLNFYGEVKLPLDLKFKLNVTPDFGITKNKSYVNVYDFGLSSNGISALSDDRSMGNNLLIENLLTFDKNFGKHKITALGGYAYQNFRNNYLLASGRGLPPGLYEIGAATKDRLNDGNSNESALTSIISRAFYGYDNRYLITATFRRDGSSKFPEKNRYGNFPSVSVGWNIAEESFLKKPVWLDQLKLRGGYGILGNQEISNYMYTSVVTSNINYPDGEGGIIQGAFPKEFANPSIKWEETAMSNIGLDLTVMNSRLNVTVDVYKKDTKDILLSVPIPISTGGANDPVRNAGRIKNTGAEFSLNWNDKTSGDFSYGLSFTGNIIKNKVMAMGDANQVINGGSNRTNVTTTRTLAGYPIGGFWLIPTSGIFKSEEEINAYQKNGTLIQPNAKPGDIRFEDFNQDGKITDNDRKYMGSPFPSFTTGLNVNLAYKGIDFMLGMQGVFGSKIYNASRLELEGVNKGANYLATALDYWSKENPNGSFPRLVWDDPNQNSRPQSDRYLESGSFFRIRNLQLGYTLPKTSFAGKFQKMRIYTSMENLLTFTKYSGYTPDIDNAGTSTSRGFDNFVYPINSIIMFGANLSF